jgi:hypothetical protein
MITILFYAFNKNRANEPQKNHHVLRRACQGPFSHLMIFCSYRCNKKIRLKYSPGYRCPGICELANRTKAWGLGVVLSQLAEIRKKYLKNSLLKRTSAAQTPAERQGDFKGSP